MTPRLARDVMTREVITVLEDTPVAELARTFAERRIHGAPVVNRKQRLVGVVSTSDIIANELRVGHEVVSEVEYYARPDMTNREELRHLGMHVEDYDDALVRDIMTPVVISAPSDATIDEVADIMGTNRIHRVLITDGERIAGVVSALDLVSLIPDRARFAEDRRREVLLATDLGPDAERVGERAVALAGAVGGQVAVVHVTPNLTALMHAYGRRPELGEVQKGFEELALARLQDLARRLARGSTPYTIVARSGDPARVILEVIEERLPEYVVVGAQRPAEERLAGLGSVAEKILLGSQVPVVTVPRLK